MITIILKHYYQDSENPHLKEIIVEDSVDYGFRYALFAALLDSKTEFTVR